MATEIERISKDMNKDRSYMADIWSENFRNKSRDWELNMWIFLLIYVCQREIGRELTVARTLDLITTYFTFTVTL